MFEVIDDEGIDLGATASVEDAELFLEAVVLHDNKINVLGGNSILISCDRTVGGIGAIRSTSCRLWGILDYRFSPSFALCRGYSSSFLSGAASGRSRRTWGGCYCCLGLAKSGCFCLVW